MLALFLYLGVPPASTVLISSRRISAACFLSVTSDVLGGIFCVHNLRQFCFKVCNANINSEMSCQESIGCRGGGLLIQKIQIERHN